jgi:hypothetical protein
VSGPSRREAASGLRVIEDAGQHACALVGIGAVPRREQRWDLSTTPVHVGDLLADHQLLLLLDGANR